MQQPILNEIKPIKELFLRQRPPRIAVAGDPGASLERLLQAVFGAPLEESAVTEAAGAWREYRSPAGARIHLLDARGSAGGDVADTPADLFLQLQRRGETVSFEALEALVSADEREQGVAAGVIGVLMSDGPVEAAERDRNELQTALRADPAVRERLAATVAVRPVVRFRRDGTLDAESDHRENIHRLAQAITRELPQEAKLEMARLSRVETVQMEIAQIVVKSVSVICGAIGAQPIPLADFPILTALQGMMVAAVMYISGRAVNLKLGAEFVAALGANAGIGLMFREGARALLKFFPGWGNAISGGVAGTGTYAVGRAAMAFFIERRSMEEARGIFRKRERKLLPPPPEVRHG